LTLLSGRLAGGNDANEFPFNLDVHHVKQPTLLVIANDRVAGFAVAAGVHQAKEGVEEHPRRFLEAHALMFAEIGRRLRRIPPERRTVEFVMGVHGNKSSSRMYHVNTIDTQVFPAPAR
jgi:hypothetical protein